MSIHKTVVIYKRGVSKSIIITLTFLTNIIVMILIGRFAANSVDLDE